MPRALLIGDIHLADRPPSIRTETYTDDILTKLEEAVDLAYETECMVIVLAGDVFHIKAPSRTSHKLVQRTADILTKHKIPVLIVPGNHDMSNDRIESLEKQPLGTLAKVEGIDLLICHDDRFPWVYGVPYLANYEEDLPGWATAYRMYTDEQKAKDFDYWPLLVTHAPIFPSGEEPPYDYINASDWAAMFERGHTYFGHIHDPNGAFTEGGMTFCNQGAISRGSLHEKTLKREPAVTVWDPFEGGFMRLPLKKVKPVEEVFFLADKQEVDDRQERLSEFLGAIGNTQLEVVGTEEVIAHAESLGLNSKTLQVIKECVEIASTKK